MSEAEQEEKKAESGAKKIPEYERPLLLVCAIAGLGPFALPLIWRHPRMKWYWKLYITLLVLGITWACIVLTKVLWIQLREKWEIIQELQS